MKKILFALLILLSPIYSQDKNKLVTDERSGKPMLIGICDKTAMLDSNFAWWYEPEYDNYEFNTAALDSIKQKLDGLSILIITGTWCSDSRREVPRFLRILDELKFNNNLLTINFVDRKKDSPDGNIASLEIKYVPTFIFYINGKELGRIIETPKTTLENDFNKILHNL